VGTAFHGLRERVFEANREIVRAGLVILTFGNASAADRAAGVMAIKPSGVPYEELAPESMVVVDLESGTDHRWGAPTFVRHADASGPVSGVRAGRRHRSHAFAVCDRVGASMSRDTVPRDDARRSLQRTGAGHTRVDAR
jgi:hypothetical protein